MTSPASLLAILAGDVLAGAAFGVVLVLFPLALVSVLTDAHVTTALPLALGIADGAVAFAALGVVLAAPATEGPSQVMMLSNLVRLPLIFVSSVFVPLQTMPEWGRWLAPFSPLSYSADLIRIGFGEPGYWSETIDALALAGYVALLLIPLIIGTIVTVHGKNGWMFSNKDGGWEFPAFWALALGVLFLLGDGAWTLVPSPHWF